MHSEETVTAFCEAFLSGMSVKEVSRNLGIPEQTIYWWIRKKDLPRQHKGPGRRTYTCDERFFRQVNSETKAYWLGFIAADGCIIDHGSIDLTLSKKDREHLTRFQKSISSTHPLHDRPKKTSLRLWSPLMVEDLALHGITPVKTFTLPFPSLSPRLMRHYIRGYVDGDGSWGFRPPSEYRFKVTSHKVFLEGLRGYLRDNLDLSPAKIRPGEWSDLVWRGRLQVLRVGHFLYDGASISLPRKKIVALIGDKAERTGHSTRSRSTRL